MAPFPGKTNPKVVMNALCWLVNRQGVSGQVFVSCLAKWGLGTFGTFGVGWGPYSHSSPMRVFKGCRLWFIQKNSKRENVSITKTKKTPYLFWDIKGP